MNKKTCYILLGILAGLALMIFTAIQMKGIIIGYADTKVNAILGKVNAIVEAAKKDQAYADAWVPPTDNAGDDVIFPAFVAGFRFTGTGTNESHDIFKDIPGRFGIYSNGSEQIIISVYRMSKLEKEACYARMMKHIEEQKGGTRFRKGGPKFYYYFYSFTLPVSETGAFWWSKGWLFYLRSDCRLELAPFLKTYLEEVSGKGLQHG